MRRDQLDEEALSVIVSLGTLSFPRQVKSAVVDAPRFGTKWF